MNTTPGEEVDAADALQGALAAEHAAVHGYAFIGAHSSRQDRARATDHREEHVAGRDALTSELVAREMEPLAAEIGYPLPSQTGEEELADFAEELEQVCGRAYLALAGTAESALRDLARRGLAGTAVRSAAWGRAPDPFPGFPDDEPPS